MTTSLDAHAAHLGRLFAFDADDLAANRAGRLSANQQVMFINAAKVARRRPRRIAIILVVAVGASLGFVAAQGAPGSQVLLAGAIAVLMGVVIMAISSLNHRSAASMESIEVRSVAGVPEFSPSMTSGRWWMTLDGVRFSMDVADTHEFRLGASYRVYYAHIWPGPAILSLEPGR